MGFGRSMLWALPTGAALVGLVTTGTPALAAGTATTALVSVSSTGEQASGPSGVLTRDVRISADGRYVAFRSRATNLVPGDTNGSADVFLRDLLVGTTTRVSVSNSGRQSERYSGLPSISADGRYVAFESLASNLVTGDTNDNGDIFVRDVLFDRTTRVSVSNAGAQGDGHSLAPSISGDGRYVAFLSQASNLVEGDTNGVPDVFVRDLETNTTTRVSSGGGVVPESAKISTDGRFVTYQTSAGVLVSDLTTGTTTRIGAPAPGGQTAVVAGRYVAYTSGTGLFLHDLLDGTTTQLASGVDEEPSLSADGRYLAYASFTGRVTEIFVHDRATATTRQLTGAAPNSSSHAPSLTADGTGVAYYSYATNLVPTDTNNREDAFVTRLPS